VLIDAGRVVDTGTHEELLARSDRYRAVLAAAEEPGGRAELEVAP
jgi:hypothetical protein